MVLWDPVSECACARDGCASAWMWVCERDDNQPQSALRAVHTWEKSQSIDVLQHMDTEGVGYYELLGHFFHA